jgi:hypothetical protein
MPGGSSLTITARPWRRGMSATVPPVFHSIQEHGDELRFAGFPQAGEQSNTPRTEITLPEPIGSYRPGGDFQIVQGLGDIAFRGHGRGLLKWEELTGERSVREREYRRMEVENSIHKYMTPVKSKLLGS